MDGSKVVKVTRISAEEAQAFRDRVKKQNEEIAKMVIIPIDEFLELIDAA